MRNTNYIGWLLYFFLILSQSAKGQNIEKDQLILDNMVTVVDRTGISDDDEHPVAFGKRELYTAIQAAGGQIENIHHHTQTQRQVYLIIGTLENNVVKRLVSDNPDILSNRPEGVFYQWVTTKSNTALVVGGTDSVGLMYALNELSQQIKDKGLSVLTRIENTLEFPDNPIRGLDRFIKDKNDDAWFFSEAYWQYYIQQLAQNRFNRLTLITGYNNGSEKDFMMPLYPFFVKVPWFDGVKLKSDIKKTRQEYLTQLRRIGQISHNYGLEFVLGIWSHGRNDTLVMGLPEDPEFYTKYCSDGMRELLEQAPEIDGIQLRVNYESGVGGFGATADKFWKDIITGIGDGYKARNGRLFLDIRAKGLTQNIREWALQTGINLHVTSKYTWEGVGLPFHPTEMRKTELAMLDNIDKRQRYGYADFLYKSRDFDYINRLWGIGTIRMFTWADPDYVKRFSHTTTFGGSRGFQVTPPMARKTNTWNLFTNDSLVYYDWEDQRYWAWHLLFGRLGYSKKTNPEVWKRTFRQHYGKSYQAVLDAYSAAGKVLPLITSSHLTYHPANYNWAEIESGGALFVSNNASAFHKDKERTYQSAEPGDPGLFYGIQDYVKDVLKGTVKPKITPIQLAKIYENLSNETLAALAKVEPEDIPKSQKTAFISNQLDLRIIAALSAYHSFKTLAATDFMFYLETKKKGYLPSSLEKMEKARENWKDIIAFTDKVYFQRPLFLNDNGTWKDRLVEIEKDIDRLKELIGDSKNIVTLSHSDGLIPIDNPLEDNFTAMVPKKATTKEPLKVTLVTGKQLPTGQTPKVHYRIANMTSGKFEELPMKWDNTNYTINIPTAQLDPEYDLLIYFTSITDEGHTTMHPGLFHEKHPTPYYVVTLNE